MRLLVLLFAALVPLSTAAQNPRFEQILIPFDTMTLETASGRWRSELWVRNNGATPVNVWAAECFQFGLPVVCSRRLDVPAGRTMLVDGFEEDGSSPGMLLYVERSRADDVVFNLRVRDLNQGLDDVGTELPIAREADMVKGTAHLINVPLQLNGRVQLRLYSPDPMAGFTVRVYAEPDGRLLAQGTYAVNAPADGFEPPELPMMVDASALFRGWIVDRVRVTVERTLPEGGAFWPLLTITNPRNNRVTTVSPR